MQTAAASGANATCPKHMEYGPCGGVEFDGTCEVAEFACVFLDRPTVSWHGIPVVNAAGSLASPDTAQPAASSIPTSSAPASSAPTISTPTISTPTISTPTISTPTVSAGAERMRATIATRPIVVADFPARALDAASIAECGGILAGSVDAVLAGDAGNARVQFSPTYRAMLIRASGVDVWTGINCRDRNRVAIEGELTGLADVGVSGVHCVTGDHTLTGDRPDALPVFDLDSTEVASLARAAGHLVSVGESPLTPPVDRRAERLVEKYRAGAEICFVNHAGGAAPVRRFIDAARGGGAELGYIPCVPVVLDRASAELLLSFTTLVLPDGYLDRILAADDPFRAGVGAVVDLSLRMLELDGVVGVNLSGGTAPGGEARFAEALAMIGQRVLT